MAKNVTILTSSVKPVKFGPAIVLGLDGKLDQNNFCRLIREKLNDAGLGNKVSKIFTIAVKAKSITSSTPIDELDATKIKEESDIDKFFRNTKVTVEDKALENAINDELLKDSETEEKIMSIRSGIIENSKYIANVGEYDRRENNYDWNIMFRGPQHRNLDFIPEDLINQLNADLKMIVNENCMVVNKHVDQNDNVRQLRFVKFVNEDEEYVQFVCSSLSEKEKSKNEEEPAKYFATLPQFEAATNIDDEKLFEKVCEKFNNYLRNMLVNKEQYKLTDYDGEIHVFRSFKEVKDLCIETLNKQKAEKKAEEKAQKAKDAAEKKSSKKKKSVEEKAAEMVAESEATNAEEPQETPIEVFPQE